MTPSKREDKAHRTIVADVEDRPGVLNRVTSLFRRRAYNIQSLTVGQTHDSGVSRITLVVLASDDDARRLEASLYKLVDVLDVRDITHAELITRDLALMKVRTQASDDVERLCATHGAKLAKRGAGDAIVELAGTPAEIDAFYDALRPLGIIEMVRTGLIAMKTDSETEGDNR